MVSFRFCSNSIYSSSSSRSVHDIGKSVNMFLKGVGVRVGWNTSYVLHIRYVPTAAGETLFPFRCISISQIILHFCCSGDHAVT